MDNLSPQELLPKLIQQLPLIDVRAPIEFQVGALPGAVNLPILNDKERELIGTTYKQQGSEAAVALGYQLISGDNKNQKLKAWLEFLSQNPGAVLYCFRGGMRSHITQSWLKEAGIEIPLITGGYKAVRQALIRVNESAVLREFPFLVVAGPTGVGKTDFLKSVQRQYPTVDLEGIAKHRGSAFGHIEQQIQPSQVDFENLLALRFLSLQSSLASNSVPYLIEDESRLIGTRALPEYLYQAMQAAPLLWVDLPLVDRVENIFKDYILNTSIGRRRQESAALLDRYEKSLAGIQRRLGGLRYQEVLQAMKKARHDFEEHDELEPQKVWIQLLLEYYYDPMYLGSIDRRGSKVLFKGNHDQCREFLAKNIFKLSLKS